VDDFGLEVEVFEVGQDRIDDLGQDLEDAGGDLLDQRLQAPGEMADEIETEREQRAEDGRGEAGEEDGHGGDEDQLDENIENGQEHFPLDGEGVEENEGQEDNAHQGKHDQQRQDQAEELAEEELVAPHGLGDEGEDRPLFDFFVDQSRPDEDGH
jgi:hypothetical protein